MLVLALLFAGASAANYYDTPCATWQYGGFGARVKQVFGVRSLEECAKYAIDNGYAGFHASIKPASGQSWQGQTYSNPACRDHCDFEIKSQSHCYMRESDSACGNYCTDGYGPTHASYTVAAGASCPLDADGKYDAAGDSAVRSNDCEGSWSECSRYCQETFTITKSESGGGNACEAENGDRRDCQPGEGQCPVHCVGAFEPCNSDCKSVYKYSTAPANGGNACKHPGVGVNVNVVEGFELRCAPGEGDCPVGPYQKARYYDTPCGTWQYGGIGGNVEPRLSGIRSVEECAKYALDNGYPGFKVSLRSESYNRDRNLQFIRYSNAQLGPEGDDWRISSTNHCQMRTTAEPDCVHYCADGYGPTHASYTVTPGAECNVDETGQWVPSDIDCEVSAPVLGTCDQECRGGKRINRRSVTRAQSGNGAVCPVLEEEDDCNPEPCPVATDKKAFKSWCAESKENCKACGGKMTKAKKAKVGKNGVEKRPAKPSTCKVKKIKCKKIKDIRVCDRSGCPNKNGKCNGKSILW